MGTTSAKAPAPHPIRCTSYVQFAWQPACRTERAHRRPHMPRSHKYDSCSSPHFETIIVQVDASRQKTVSPVWPSPTRRDSFEPMRRTPPGRVEWNDLGIGAATTKGLWACMLSTENLWAAYTAVLRYLPQRRWSALIPKKRAYGCGRVRYRRRHRLRGPNRATSKSWVAWCPPRGGLDG